MVASPEIFKLIHSGEVTRRDDPEKLGRIKARIVGVVEPETPNWCWPVGCQSSGPGKGHYEPPSVGSTVMVFFRLGDPDKPFFFTGPWGKPRGETDVPEGAETEGDDRQRAVTEDEEWRISRDSRTTSKLILVEHKNSDLAILIDSTNDKVFLVRDNANQAFIRGTEYRSEEASLLTSLQTNLATAGTQLSTAGTDPTLVALASLAAAALNSAGIALSNAASAISSSPLATATEYLSEKLFGE